MPSKRDPTFERELAAAATRKAGLAGVDESFFAAVQHRLAKGELEYNGTWAERGLPTLIEELIEEGADGGGWGTLAARLAQLDPEVAEEAVLEEIMLAIAGAVQLWYHGHRALELVRDP